MLTPLRWTQQYQFQEREHQSPCCLCDDVDDSGDNRRSKVDRKPQACRRLRTARPTRISKARSGNRAGSQATAGADLFSLFGTLLARVKFLSRAFLAAAFLRSLSCLFLPSLFPPSTSHTMAKAAEKKADKKAAKAAPAKKAAASPAAAKAVAKKVPVSSKEILAKAKEQVRSKDMLSPFLPV